MSRTNVSQKIKDKNKKEDKYKKDPRPKIGDFPNREAYRQAVLKWRIRQGYAKAPKPEEKKKYVSPRERKFGKSKLKVNKEIKQQVETYVQKMKGDKPINKVDYPSKTVKKEKPKNVPVQENKKDNKDDKKKVTVTETQTPVTEKKKESLKAKPKKLIKKKKGKGFVSTKSARGKQLLKIEERKRKLREKRFGKK